MKKYFFYELKKNLWTFVLLSVVLSLIYVATISTMNLTYSYPIDEYTLNVTIASPQVSLLGGMMLSLCFLSPVIMFSFKMNKRGVDAFYALPLKKEKLYFVKAMVGLLLVILPFTIAYWLGFLTLLLREGNPYQMIWYLPMYFGELLFAVCLFGINAFLFTRANRVGDGVTFMLAYAVLGVLVVWVLQEIVDQYFFHYYQEQSFLTFGGQLVFENNMEYLIRGYRGEGHWTVWMFVYPIALAAVSYFLLFYNLRYEKGENAEQISNSWFGFRVLIPTYVALLIAMATSNSSGDLLAVCLILVGGITATIVYQRKIKFSWRYWLMLGIGVGIGILLGVFVG